MDADIKQLEVLRRLDIAERAEIVFQLSDNLRRTVEAGVRQRHPDWDDQAVKRCVLRLTIGERLFQEIFADAS
jgi:hypothetical protein